MRELCLNEMQTVSGGIHAPEDDARIFVLIGVAGLITGGAAFVFGGTFFAGFACGSLTAAFVIPELAI